MSKKITLPVIFSHLFFIVLLLFSPAKKTSLPKKHIAVRTVAETPKTTAATVRPKKTPPAKSKPISSAKKPAVIEKKKPLKPKVPKETHEPLAKIEEKVYPKPRLKLDIPQLKTPAPENKREIAEESLVSFLHSSLNLPEFGEVKIQLTVKKDGTVTRLVVLQAESKKNKAYLEEYLPRLQFPLGLDTEKTFTLTFCNEI